ncbi:helix-turn-helix domain-containing protein [Planococcus wigleyi]|uniref:Helix-turn-helix domain-containing protein n=1 Tax=Planococcus wigleyi TaxID=2762216 RepID=A0ABR8WDE4_9BACL|nr:helix-turn-helix domain-containing protein [Planococcus wigleyi]MBD8015047.1 helix-turn-helix domain-containing protein [Planococcus wigleyi]
MQPSYTAAEVARVLGCSVPTVYGYANKGWIRKVDDPHNLSGSTRFVREDVDQLKAEQEQLHAAGRSITEVAKQFGVYPQKVKEAISALTLDIQSVPLTVHSAKQRYAVTKEQEQEIGAYLKQQKSTRSKRNHLYVPAADVALYQSFLLAGEQPVRLKYNDQKELGFFLDDNDFLLYLEALRSYDLEPRYAIHQEKQEVQQGFTDLVVPTGKKAFYRILDVLYAVCGVENFNAEVRNGQLVASIRNGQYPLNEFVAKDALRILRNYIQSGKVVSEGNHWIFSRSDRTVQLVFKEEVYEELVGLAEAEGLSVQEWALRTLIKKRVN